ncbi:hypothetical protein pb186bvf_001219 [Paramecium bursaria]
MDFKKYLKILPETLEKYNIPFDKVNEFRKTFNGNLPQLHNRRLVDAFQSVANFDRAPVWMMRYLQTQLRQAGRYLPEFKETSKDFDFFQKCENPFIAAEITLQPIKRFELDGAIIFADILTLPKQMGFEIVMEEAKGPVIKNPLVTPDDLQRIKTPNPESLEHVYDAQFLVRLALQAKQALIGFCGGPWTVFSYLVEGGTSKAFTKAKKWLYQYTDSTLKVLEMLARSSADYLINQVKQGGAQVLQIFDSWAGAIPARDYIEFVIPSLTILLQLVKEQCPDTPIIMFAKDQNTKSVIVELLKLSSNNRPFIDGFQLDGGVEDDVLVKIIEADRTIQGNLEPGVLYGTQQFIKQRIQETIERLQTTRRYVVNLAHGLTPEHTVDNTIKTIQSQADIRMTYQSHINIKKKSHPRYESHYKANQRISFYLLNKPIRGDSYKKKIIKSSPKDHFYIQMRPMKKKIEFTILLTPKYSSPHNTNQYLLTKHSGPDNPFHSGQPESMLAYLLNNELEPITPIIGNQKLSEQQKLIYQIQSILNSS